MPRQPLRFIHLIGDQFMAGNITGNMGEPWDSDDAGHRCFYDTEIRPMAGASPPTKVALDFGIEMILPRIVDPGRSAFAQDGIHFVKSCRDDTGIEYWRDDNDGLTRILIALSFIEIGTAFTDEPVDFTSLNRQICSIYRAKDLAPGGEVHREIPNFKQGHGRSLSQFGVQGIAQPVAQKIERKGQRK